MFWALCAVVLYVYLGYPLLVTALARAARGVAPSAGDSLPTVTLFFCVHNEKAVLDAKIANCVSIDYPRDRLAILAASDGSTDGSAEALQRLEEAGTLKAVIQPFLSGKTRLLNRAIETVRTDLVLFTDASTLLRPGAVRAHARHYA